jgi:hypothetical protein
VYEAWSRREAELERVMQTVSAAAVERLEAMSYAEVCRRAQTVEATLAAVAREHGGAATVMGSEEDDWVALRLEMELDDCATVAEMPFGHGRRWAVRMAAHAAARRDRAPTRGVVPSEGMHCVPTHLVLWNWCQRRLLMRRSGFSRTSSRACSISICRGTRASKFCPSKTATP